ncbi:MAG TPA: PAS domain-containing protein, partial [Sphingorhabdus sp.]|nr:PAS domain-containing protein [Sphingorhabdus sp.]
MAARKFSWGTNSEKSAEPPARGLLGKLGQRQPTASPAATSKDALLLLQNFEESGRGWFWSTDAEGRITYLSQSVCQRLGKSCDELAGKDFVELFLKPDSSEDRQRTLPWVLMRQSKFDDLALQASETEEEIWWAVSGRPYHNANGEFAGYRGSGTDITEQRRASKDNDRLAT